jgi:hypothetical protein
MNEDRTEANFIRHCDNGDYDYCDLGRFEYTCMYCKGTTDDYGDLWWDNHESIWNGEPIQFKCERCTAPLEVYYDSEEGEIYVRPAK